MNIGARLRERSPWAMVLPPGSSFSALSWSTWIHCSSQVAFANMLMRSWVISTQSLAPISWPTADLISSNPSNILMPCTSFALQRILDSHLWNRFQDQKIGLRDSHHLRHADAGRGLQQRHLSAREADDGELSDDEINRSRGGEG